MPFPLWGWSPGLSHASGPQSKQPSYHTGENLGVQGLGVPHVQRSAVCPSGLCPGKAILSFVDSVLASGHSSLV